jgi:CelD/BcsL family acetyltransferase involved in cellulose biosynthesis
MKVKEINTYDDFLALKDEWTNLLEKCNHTVFSTWEWLSIWWKHFGKNKKLLILLAEDHEKPVGIAPLMYYVDKTFGLRTRKIQLIGTPQSDYNEFILAKKEEECIKAFIDYILDSFPERWDCIELRDIPENSRTLAILKNTADKLRIASIKVIHTCPYLPLPKSSETLLQNLSKNFRYNIKRYMKKMVKDYKKVEFTSYEKFSTIEEAVGVLFELHQKRWSERKEPGAFRNKIIRKFHLEIANLFSRLNWLNLDFIMADDKAVACLYGFKYRSKLYYYLSGFNPIFTKYSPGNLLIFHILQKCIENGLSEFDFLRGEEEYKTCWTSLSRKNFDIVLVKKGLYPLIRDWVTRKYRFGVRSLKNVVNPH